MWAKGAEGQQGGWVKFQENTPKKKFSRPGSFGVTGGTWTVLVRLGAGGGKTRTKKGKDGRGRRGKTWVFNRGVPLGKKKGVCVNDSREPKGPCVQGQALALRDRIGGDHSCRTWQRHWGLGVGGGGKNKRGRGKLKLKRKGWGGFGGGAKVKTGFTLIPGGSAREGTSPAEKNETSLERGVFKG